MISQISQYTGEIFIPNLTGTAALNTVTQAELTAMAAIYELDYLEKMFGSDMAQDIISAYAASQVEGYAGSYWDDLLELLTDQTHGCVLAYYVYFAYRRNKLSATTPAGEVIPVVENSTFKNATYKLVKAWNQMVVMSEEVWDYVEENSDLFVNYDSTIEFPFEKINSFGI